MDKVEQRVLEAIDLAGMTQYLQSLIAVRSLGGQETAGQEHVAAEMRRLGLEVDLWPFDLAELRQHPSFCMETERQEGLGLVGSLGEGSGGRSLMLVGHVDVVPAGDAANWHFDPWQGTVADGRLYGRGAVDMKGGLCCCLYAAKAIRDAGARLRGRMMVASVIGEEDGGVGALGTVLRGYSADGAVIAEPTQLTIAPAQAGALGFRVTVHGRSAHGCVRAEGVSAIEKFVPVHAALLALEKRRNSAVHDPLYARYALPYALSIGELHAGNWSSSVPEQAVFTGRYGVAVGEDLASARCEFEAAVAEAAQADPWLREHPPAVEWWGGMFDSARVASDHPIVQTVAGAYRDLAGSETRLEGVPYGSDMRLLVNVGGTPAVLYGPGDVRVAHMPDEFVPLDDLRRAVESLALTALRFCGHD